MLCPACHADTVVLETRPAGQNTLDVARRRRCMNPYCQQTFSTREAIDVDLVVKRQPVTPPPASAFKSFAPDPSPTVTPQTDTQPATRTAHVPRQTRTTLKGHRQQVLDDWTQTGVVGTIEATEQTPE